MRGRIVFAAVALALAGAAPAQAVEDCADAPEARTLLSGQGVLESVIGGPDGRLYYTDTTKQALMRLDAPDAQPEVVSGGIQAPGGLLVSEDGQAIIVGQGDGFVQGAIGNVTGLARLLRVDLATGAQSVVAEGLSMANGLARDEAGTIYASDDVSLNIDRVSGADVVRGWASVASPNGLAIDSTGRWLLAAQTFVPAAVARVDLTNPARVEPYFTAGVLDVAAGLDGMTIDGQDRLFAAANAANQVWRIDTDRTACALARGVQSASAVAFGGGGAFPEEHLYAVGFGGTVVEIPDARPAPPAVEPALLTVRVKPRTIRAKRRTRVTVRVLRSGSPVAGARVRILRRSARTNAAGRARLKVRPPRRGRYAVRVTGAAVPPATATLRVRRAAPGPRGRGPTG